MPAYFLFAISKNMKLKMKRLLNVVRILVSELLVFIWMVLPNQIHQGKIRKFYFDKNNQDNVRE